MSPINTTACLCAGLLVSSLTHAREIESVAIETMDVPQFDIMRAGVTQTGDMDLDGNPGDLAITRFDMRSLLSAPIPLWEGMSMIPMFAYSAT